MVYVLVPSSLAENSKTESGAFDFNVYDVVNVIVLTSSTSFISMAVLLLLETIGIASKFSVGDCL